MADSNEVASGGGTPALVRTATTDELTDATNEESAGLRTCDDGDAGSVILESGDKTYGVVLGVILEAA